MTSAAIPEKPAFCAEKQRLSEIYLEAMRESTQLESAQMDAVINGKAGLERYELAVQVARENRDRAKLAYMLHVQAHGC